MTPVHDDLESIHNSAKELNDLADKASKAIQHIEGHLTKASLGVECTLGEILAIEGGKELRLGYGRVGQNWCLIVDEKPAAGEKPGSSKLLGSGNSRIALASAPRHMRILALRQIPNIISTLAKVGMEMVSAATVDMDSINTALKEIGTWAAASKLARQGAAQHKEGEGRQKQS